MFWALIVHRLPLIVLRDLMATSLAIQNSSNHVSHRFGYLGDKFKPRSYRLRLNLNEYFQFIQAHVT
jgi:hypothetical protein